MPSQVFVYSVHVTCETQAQADAVMRERIGHDEEIEFDGQYLDYTIEWMGGMHWPRPRDYRG